MFISVSLPLIYEGNRRNSNARGFPEDFRIQQVCEQLGYGLRRRLEDDGTEQTIHKTRYQKPGREVQCKTTPHYRDIAVGNTPKSTAQHIKNEIDRYCIFYGALPRFKAHVFVNRVSSGSLTVYVHAKDLGVAASGFAQLLSELLRTDVIDGSRTAGCEVKVYSMDSADLVGQGHLTSSGWPSFWFHFGTDILLIVLILSMLITYLLVVPGGGAGAIQSSFLVAHGDSIFQSIVAGLITLIASLVVRFVKFKPKPINWDNLN